jgi:hypothetical protein
LPSNDNNAQSVIVTIGSEGACSVRHTRAKISGEADGSGHTLDVRPDSKLVKFKSQEGAIAEVALMARSLFHFEADAPSTRHRVIVFDGACATA